MPKYSYKALDDLGNPSLGELIASDEKELRSILDKQGLYLIEFKEKKPLVKASFFSVSSKVKEVEVINFCRQFAIMINAGVSIVESIATLKEQGTPRFKEILSDVHSQLLVGKSLSEAFEKYPKVFPAFFRNMVYIGEISGTLDSVLNNLADYYEKDLKVKRKAKSAMVYPSILLALTLIVVVVMMVVVIPMFENMFAEYGNDIPSYTKAIFNISDFFTTYWPFIIVGIVLLILLNMLFFKTKAGARVKDWFKLHTPIVSIVQHNIITARFARGFGVLVSSGLQIVDALEIMTKILGNKLVEDKFSKCVDEIKRGRRISSSLQLTHLFPNMLIEMINVGEQTGSLDTVLMKSADYYDNSVETSITRATTLIEPIMLLIMGVLVGFIIVSIFIPMLSMMQSIGNIAG